MIRWSIITPSFNQLDWLRVCIASVRDQVNAGISLEHIIQDGGTPDFKSFAEVLGARSLNQREWLIEEKAYRLHLISEPDQGMYDAINRGFSRACGDLVAHLNCDEQYLEGALARVSSFFEADPNILMLTSGVLVLNKEGLLVCSREGLSPWIPHIATDHLPTFTAATFYRRSVVEKPWRRFDTRFRACADALWMMERLREGVRPKVISGYTSLFFDTGGNLVLTPTAREEAEFIYHQAPRWVRYCHPLWRWAHRLRKLFKGEYCAKKLTYSVYLPLGTQHEKKTFTDIKTRGIWWGRLKYSARKG